MPTVQGRRAGRLDRRVDLYVRSTSTDSFGDVADVYTLVQAGAWANLRQASPKEVFEAEHDIAVQKAVFQIRYRTGITVTNRVVYDGQNYDVAGCVEVGRRQYLDLHAVLEPRQ